MAALITFVAFLVDWVIGDPQNWPHPVRLLGRLIAWGEVQVRFWVGDYSPTCLLVGGAGLSLGIVFFSLVVTALILGLAAGAGAFWHFLVGLYLVFSLLCMRDLYHQTLQVENLLLRGYLSEARQKLAWVVGRDTGHLDETGIRRALIETLAENFSDGIVAPLFYLALGGPPLAWAYKAVNTLDSMIGYKNERYLYLGRFAARLDDIANFIPARLSGWLLILAARLRGLDYQGARKISQRDGRLHFSLNSGWPEAAMAGALGVRLGGGASYGGVWLDKPVINLDGVEAGAVHLQVAKDLMVGAAVLMLGLTLASLLIFTGSLGWF